MPRVGFNLSDDTARRVREFALKKTGSMKGLSIVGEEALKEYLDRHENELNSGKQGNELALFA